MVWSGIAIFYFACALFGFLFALIAAIFGELGAHAHFEIGGHDVDLGHEVGHDIGHIDHGVEAGHPSVEHPMPGASIFNGLTITTFIGSFGIMGLVAVWGLRFGPTLSVAFALPSSIVIASGQFLLYVRLLVNAQASSEATLSETLGCEAVVISSVPADRVGQISYVVKGTRYTAPACSADGQDIPRGTRVQIVNVRGATYVVRPT